MKPTDRRIFHSYLSRLFSLLCLLFIVMASAQTTFTESAAAYGLDLGQRKDGGHAWADFDNDGDLDVLVLENNNNGSVKSYLMRQDPVGTFTNVQATLAPGMLGAYAERQAAWGDLNNDGRPDFMINSSGNSNSRPALQIFIQNTNGTFGDGAGGTTPITVGRSSGYTITINPVNAEGAGFFDFEGDGDLDIFFDSHNYGIELLRNNYIDHTNNTTVNPTANSLFTHITTGNGSGVVQFGLNQFATDGDYGSAADVNDDGWVDIFMRKRDENDFFLNQGGTFTNGADLAQAANANKGANGLFDLDNDGDLDAVWTENGLTQIFRNDGPGVWTPLGAGTFPSLPQPGNVDSGTSADDIDALAGGDIDNDGDIDILFVGDGRSYLYLNQLNSPTPAPGTIGSGSAMNFVLDSETFNSGRNGEGTTMVDIDDDGDLDIYININNNANQLYINNLPAANRNNHLIIDVTEDRAADGTTGGFAGRVAIGTNVLLKDCEGNIISGLRQVNGVYGHGTQQPEQVHFGLPLGENETYIIEVRYPNFVHPTDGVTRLIATVVAQPSTISGTNHYDMSTTDAEIVENPNPPDAVDDLQTVTYGNTVSVQISLFDNDSEPDGEDFFIESVVQPAVGSVVIDDADLGLVTYTYSAGIPFPGATFDYTITDSTVSICPALGKSDTATVTIFEPCADAGGLDSDGDGINDICDEDDDNDGILDVEERPQTVLWVTNGTPGSEEQNTIDKLTAFGWSVTVVDDGVGGDANNYAVTFIYEDANSGTALTNVSNMLSTEKGVITTEPFLHDDLLGASTGANTNTDVLNVTNNTHPVTFGIPLGNYDIGDGSSRSNGLVSGTVLGLHPNGEVSMAVWEQGDALDMGTAPGRRAIVPHANSNGGFNAAGVDLLFNAITWTAGIDTDGDGIDNHLDNDSDGDGCFDAIEGAGNFLTTDVDINGRLNGGVGSNGVPTISGSPQATLAAVTDASDDAACFDTDSDGIPDSADLDDDNDGILDDDEGCLNYSTSIETQTGVGNPSDILGAPDSSFAELHTNGDVITIDFQRIFSAGTQYILTWRRRPGRADGEVAQPIILESSDNATFNQLSVHPQSSVDAVVIDTLTSESNFRYLRFTKEDVPSVVDFQIDAIGILSCILDSDSDGRTDNIDLDSDNDGCSDANEAYADANADGGDNAYYATGNPPAVNTDGTVTLASYAPPADGDNNGTLDHQEAGNAPAITAQPSNTSTCPGCDASFTVAGTDSDTNQWQFFNGTSWIDLTDSGIYSGTSTTTLILSNISPSDNGNQYRAIVSNSSYACSEETSISAILAVQVTTVITNRRITYRVNKN